METLYRLSVVTADMKNGVVDTLFIVIKDSSGNVSRKLSPQLTPHDGEKRESVTTFDFGPNEGVKPPFALLEIWRGTCRNIFGNVPFLNKVHCGHDVDSPPEIFLDRVEISVMNDLGEDGFTHSRSNWCFPVHRWLKDNIHYYIHLHDCILPQHDLSRKEFRLFELTQKREIYEYAEVIKNGPIMAKHFPEEEKFKKEYYWTFVEKKMLLVSSKELIQWTTKNFTTLDGIADVFKFVYERPAVVDVWREDWWFAAQRLQGLDAGVISLCEAIPDYLEVPDFISDLLEGKTLRQALKNKKLFICDLTILKEITVPEGRQLAYPYAIFYLNDKDELLPIMIQLRGGEKRCVNPVYTPRDNPNTWLAAKMYYNNAEAQHHQSGTHLGKTHFLMEGVWVAVNRCLSVSHPLYKLMAPHFLYLIGINTRGREKLINPGGWIDATMTQGVDGMYELMAVLHRSWTFKDLNPIYTLTQKGTMNQKVLPNYPYRDDAICLYAVIQEYVRNIVANYYDSSETVKSDWELQNFRKELTAQPTDGLGFKDVPGNDDGFSTIDEVVETVTSFISTSTLAHAASNSQQYNQYSFVPNYPGMLNKGAPTEKLDYTEEDLLALLPKREVILNTIIITNLLSFPITNPLGDFEVQYLFHPKDLIVVDRFKDKLKKLSSEFEKRNQRRRVPYPDLDPALVPNSISI